MCLLCSDKLVVKKKDKGRTKAMKRFLSTDIGKRAFRTTIAVKLGAGLVAQKIGRLKRR
jgi:predicted N-formylglutamate amidohydrolase